MSPAGRVQVSEGSPELPVGMNTWSDFLLARRFDQALPIVLAELEKNPDDWQLLYAAGQCSRFCGCHDDATRYLWRASERKPRDVPTLLALGIALQQQREFVEAVRVLGMALECDPDFPLAYNSLALTQRLNGELEKALHNYDAGAKALARRFVRRMRNDQRATIVAQRDTRGHLWLTYAAFGAMVSAADAGVAGVAWPTDESARQLERRREYGGLFFNDVTRGWLRKRMRLFLPNYFNTFREHLTLDSTYANLIGNRGTVLRLLGRDEEADLHFAEAEEFSPQRKPFLEEA